MLCHLGMLIGTHIPKNTRYREMHHSKSLPIDKQKFAAN